MNAEQKKRHRGWSEAVFAVCDVRTKRGKRERERERERERADIAARENEEEEKRSVKY